MKIKAGTRAEKLREAIEEGIATGAFAPGMHLDETELAQRFGVSRTPLREALIQLSSMGIVVLRPRRGALVAEVTPQRLLEMFEVMAELEAMCGRLAARRMSADDHEVLMRAHKACEAACRAENPDAYYHENEQFHYAIYAGSHSGFLIEQTTAMHRRLRPYRRLQLRVRNRLATSFSEHNGVVEALIAGDAEVASERLRQHILVQGERFTDLLASIASLRARNDAPSPEAAASQILPL
jgi:DNA-binding GntR family transcriptional regulator